MRLRFVLLVLAALLPAACASGPQTEAGSPERAVEDSFLAFQAALLAGDGAQVAALTTADSGNFYRDMADEALTAGRARLSEMTLDHRLVALTLRHGLTALELKRMSGKELLQLCVDRGWIWVEQGWIDRQDFARKRPENYRIIGEAAAARVDNPLSWPRDGVAFRFEEGAWRVRLRHDSGAPNLIAEALIAYYRFGREMSEEEYIYATLEEATGKRPGPDIWSPPL